MRKVSIVGGGNVGTNTAFFIAENRSASVMLVDMREGVTTGNALDLMEAGPLRGYDTFIRGADSIEAIEGSHVVLLTAGRSRRPGEKRIDPYVDNAKTVLALCEDIQRVAPEAIVVNMVEPIDLLTKLAQEALGFNRHRVLGVGGLLTSTRLRYLVSDCLDISPREVTAVVVGPHHESMVILKDTIRVSGLPVTELMDEITLNGLIEEARTAGDKILASAQRSTSYYAPSAAAASLVESIVRDTHATMPVSMVCDGEYGVEGISIGVLARIGVKGVEAIIDVPMTEVEREAFRKAVAGQHEAWEQVNRNAPGA